MLEQLDKFNFYNEMTDLIDERRAVDVVYIDFSRAFNTAFHCLQLYEFFTEKLVKCELNQHRARWTEY